MLLDTCALLWLAHDQTQLSPGTLNKIDKAPMLFISAVTGFEIVLKHKASKLHLPLPAREWLKELLSHHQINVIDLDMEICIRTTELPPIHKDPCDRFIIATALILGFPVVTGDSRFNEYGVEVLR
jgi:PIN domain nuclease of toxin-antitoxin system